MIRILIDEDVLLDMLLDRLEVLTSDTITIEFFKRYYSELLHAGCFEGMEFNVNVIVDNDYINYCQVCTPEEYQEQYNSSTSILAEYAKDGNVYLLVSTY